VSRTPLDPAAVQAVAMDLDRTILGPSLDFTPALLDAVDAVRASGVEPIIATGRMFRSARPYAKRLGITAPMVCYQGALVADPVSGEWLRHEPVPVDLAREVIRAIAGEGEHMNVYVDDELYVAEVNEEALEYARHSRLEPRAVGDLAAWLTEPTTKVVAVGEPARMTALGEALRRRFGGRLYIATSLPEFLEVAKPGVSKGMGLLEVCERLGLDPARTIGFGDGANDLELLETAGFGVGIEEGDADLRAVADLLVAGPAGDGVAAFLSDLARARGLDSKAG
jgi:Cof subfamily protein (haloacid dehalogenase superfamily)